MSHFQTSSSFSLSSPSALFLLMLVKAPTQRCPHHSGRCSPSPMRDAAVSSAQFPVAPFPLPVLLSLSLSLFARLRMRAFGINGGEGRCYRFWTDFMQCMQVRAAKCGCGGALACAHTLSVCLSLSLFLLFLYFLSLLLYSLALSAPLFNYSISLSVCLSVCLLDSF